MDKVLKDRRIRLIYSNSNLKASVVENGVRYVKNKIYKFCTANETDRYIDHIQAIVNAKNLSKSRVTGMSPEEITFKKALP